jgi:hypothetical protein
MSGFSMRSQRSHIVCACKVFRGPLRLAMSHEQTVKAGRPDRWSTTEQVILFTPQLSLLFCISSDLRQLHIESVESVQNL